MKMNPSRRNIPGSIGRKKLNFIQTAIQQLSVFRIEFDVIYYHPRAAFLDLLDRLRTDSPVRGPSYKPVATEMSAPLYLIFSSGKRRQARSNAGEK